MAQVNRERKERRVEADEVMGSHHAWIKRQPCELRNHLAHRCGFYVDRQNIEGHHLKHTGSGGKDRDNEIPCCPVGHDELHHAGNVSSQCARFGRDLRSIAVEYTARYDAENPTQENLSE